MEYLINPRDKGENEQTYQDALGLLRVNAVNESNAKIGDTILLASGVGEIAAAAKAAPVFLKGFFSTTGKTFTEKSSSLVSATRQGAAKAESRATENASVLDDSAETVVSSSSQDAVGNATTTQVEGVVTKDVLKQFGRGLDDLAASANNPINKEGLTSAARALSKHASGQRATGTFPQLKGGIANQNQMAKQIVSDILGNSKSTFTNLKRGGLEVRAPDDRGLRFNSDGGLSGFLDPKL